MLFCLLLLLGLSKLNLQFVIITSKFGKRFCFNLMRFRVLSQI